MSNRRHSEPQSLLTIVLVISLFMTSAVLAGFAQNTNSSPADIYKTNCVACHGPDGRGSAVGKSLHVPDFHSPHVQQQPDAQLSDVISQGRGNMPPFGGQLTNDQVGALVKYIRTLGSTK